MVENHAELTHGHPALLERDTSEPEVRAGVSACRNTTAVRYIPAAHQYRISTFRRQSVAPQGTVVMLGSPRAHEIVSAVAPPALWGNPGRQRDRIAQSLAHRPPMARQPGRRGRVTIRPTR